jgi:hypothetical protein
VSQDYQSVKGEHSIVLKTKDGTRIVIANQVFLDEIPAGTSGVRSFVCDFRMKLV